MDDKDEALEVKTIEDRLKRLEELPDTKAILNACAEIHKAHEQFANTTRSLQERMVDAAEIKAKIDVIRNRCNNIMQIAPHIENVIGILQSMAGMLGCHLQLVEGIYTLLPNSEPKKNSKMPRAQRRQLARKKLK